jgi:hypothetical protein
LGRDSLRKFNIHASETSWVGTNFEAVFDNNGSLDDLFEQVESIL